MSYRPDESDRSFVVRPAGFESAAYGSGGRRSIQLSYGARNRSSVPDADVPRKNRLVMMNGLPSGQTMAARRIDDRHSTTVVKYQGKLFATSNAELSADGKVMKVENDVIVGTPGQEVGQRIDYWDKQ